MVSDLLFGSEVGWTDYRIANRTVYEWTGFWRVRSDEVLICIHFFKATEFGATVRRKALMLRPNERCCSGEMLSRRCSSAGAMAAPHPACTIQTRVPGLN